MQEKINFLNEIKGKRLSKEFIFSLEEWKRVSGYVEELRESVTYYIDRHGFVVEMTKGDESPPERIFPRKKTWKLSGVRAVRFLPGKQDFPRGRERIMLHRYRLDMFIGIMPNSEAVMVLPEVEDGKLSAESEKVVHLDPGEFTSREFFPLADKIESALIPEKRRQTGKKQRQRALLAGVHLTSSEFEGSGAGLEELVLLCETAGFEAVELVQQKRSKPDPGFFIGRGKAHEMRNMILDKNLDGVILSEDIKYNQKRNLKQIVGVPVMDRTDLILHIFAQHAASEEGRLQVKIAMINQHLQQMIKDQKFLDRPGAGIGTRGPGETAQEMARRLIYKRKQDLEDKLARISAQRKVRRKRRKSMEVNRIALVGYTNAGKSTLLNYLSGAKVKTANQLFTTLETRTRKCILPNDFEVLFSDTVGFIRNLPHHLIEAFHSTLEEALDADLICMLLDSSDPAKDEHLKTINDTLVRLEADEIPRILVMNKIDRLTEQELEWMKVETRNAVFVSAVTGQGMDELADGIRDKLMSDKKKTQFFIPYAQAGIMERIHRNANIIERKFDEEGILITAVMSEKLIGKYEEFVV